ncbi:MAG: M20/M25/M40 family metallo-hydrolase [Acidobacteria bacterium]|nr:M20/M25/M40 family metallo-hydrolase [Acidobacteriota bacterium]
MRGSDPKLREEAIVVGAHYDHLGLGERSSLAPSLIGQVHAGADDNASGTAAVLEMARAMSKQKGQLKRSVVFLAFSAEELGLLGSGYYTKAPAWALEKTAAMVNLDMVGRPRDNKLYVGGIGTSPGFKALVEEANHGSFNLGFDNSGYGSSDHQSFYLKSVPVIFFFSGLHSDYHKPSDLPERIQSADHARVAEFALRTADTLATMEARPQYVRVVEPARPVSGSGGSGYGPYFGSIPDMGEEVEGVKFGDVREGSPAALAGFKAGDILVEFGGKPIKNLYDFTFALREHKPGDEVSVTVLRGKERITAPVKLTPRS